MRASLPTTLLLASLLAACSTASTPSPIGKHPQSGPLKAHPELTKKSANSTDTPPAQNAPATPEKQ